MPIAFVMECCSVLPGGVWLSRFQGRGLQGAFLEAIRRISPKDAEALHQGSGERPYTISLLERPGSNDKPLQEFRIRVTLLDDELIPVVLQLSTATLREPLQIGQQSFVIKSIDLGAGRNPEWVGIAGWQDLWQYAEESNIFRLEFSTPVSFQQSFQERDARIEIPIPLPSLVFGGALRRWQRWSGIEWSDTLRESFSVSLEMTTPLALEAFEVPISFGQTTRHVVGCVGQVTYRANRKKVDPEHLRQFNALANSLHFTGAGKRTTMGMGRVRRLSLNS